MEQERSMFAPPLLHLPMAMVVIVVPVVVLAPLFFVAALSDHRYHLSVGDSGEIPLSLRIMTIPTAGL